MGGCFLQKKRSLNVGCPRAALFSPLLKYFLWEGLPLFLHLLVFFWGGGGIMLFLGIWLVLRERPPQPCLLVFSARPVGCCLLKIQPPHRNHTTSPLHSPSPSSPTPFTSPTDPFHRRPNSFPDSVWVPGHRGLGHPQLLYGLHQQLVQTHVDHGAWPVLAAGGCGPARGLPGGGGGGIREDPPKKKQIRRFFRCSGSPQKWGTRVSAEN